MRVSSESIRSWPEVGRLALNKRDAASGSSAPETRCIRLRFRTMLTVSANSAVAMRYASCPGALSLRKKKSQLSWRASTLVCVFVLGEPIMSPTNGAHFATTPWTVLEDLRKPRSQQELDDSIAMLSALYWPCIYVFLRRRGHRADDAADMTQAFFSDVVLQRQLFVRASPARGRLRTLLRTALTHFCLDMHRRQSVVGRKFVLTGRELSEQERFINRFQSDTDDCAFDRQWACRVLQESLRRCEHHYMEADRAGHWHAYRRRVVDPCCFGSDPPCMGLLADELGFANANAVASAIHVVKTRIQLLIRQIIRESTPQESDADAEIAYLENLLSA